MFGGGTSGARRLPPQWRREPCKTRGSPGRPVSSTPAIATRNAIRQILHSTLPRPAIAAPIQAGPLAVDPESIMPRLGKASIEDRLGRIRDDPIQQRLPALLRN